MDSLGLYFYNARWYDPALGRFAQADTLIPGAGSSQAWDRYAYSMNNPLRYIDPSGHCPWCIAVGVGAVVGAAVGYGIQVYDNYQSGVTGTDILTTNISAEPIVNGAFIGAGAVLGVGLIATAPIVVAAAGAACADGDCTNEAVAAEEVASNAVQVVNGNVQGAGSTQTTAIVPYFPPNMGAAEGEFEESIAYKGQILSRIGSDKGNFFSEPGTPTWQLSLPPAQQNGTERLFQVAKPFFMYSSHASSWFNQAGGGIQYRTIYHMNLEWLLRNEYLIPAE